MGPSGPERTDMAEYINETVKIIEQRTSCRSFIPDSLTEEEREIITSAALRAPNGGKMSKFALIDVRDPELKKKVAKWCDNQKFIEDAPGVYVVLSDFSRWFRLFRKHVKSMGAPINYPREDEILLCEIDAVLAAENMVIAAQSMGISSCFIADIITNYKEVKETLKLPKYVMPITLLIMGRPKNLSGERTARIAAPVVFTDCYKEIPDGELDHMVAPLIPKDIEGKPVMSEDEFIKRYYIRRLGSWLSFDRAINVKEMFADWLSSPYEE